MSFPRIHPTVTRLSETATRYITAKTPTAEARPGEAGSRRPSAPNPRNRSKH